MLRDNTVKEIDYSLYVCFKNYALSDILIVLLKIEASKSVGTSFDNLSELYYMKLWKKKQIFIVAYD